ncbi:MAG: acetate kinase [Zetaproteobacteria bacterium]|nr:MAG: acetate kinase [Zetaproteobacteria bacterium]
MIDNAVKRHIHMKQIILTMNVGSSSLRLDAFGFNGAGPHRLAALHEPAAAEPYAPILRDFVRMHGLKNVAVVAHRIVHGGGAFTTPCLLHAGEEKAIADLAYLAPLHNPPALAGVRACREVLGSALPQMAVFDTAFYAALPEVAAIYALPHELVRKHGLRRYGFHGIAHQAMWRRWRALRPDLADGGRVISLQLGSGCSITAMKGDLPKDTSMGFSPLEGLVMATRPGDVDAGVLVHLQREAGLDGAALERMLNRESGLLGMSGKSGDMRRLLASDDADARLAIDLYCYRARKYIGAYVAALGGVDGILFGGGVGEHCPSIRAGILNGLECLGIALDGRANAAARGGESLVSAPGAGVQTWVMAVDEALVLAREAENIVWRDAAGGIHEQISE